MRIVLDTNIYISLVFSRQSNTGDEDLLVLHPWRGVSIMQPAGALALLV